MKREKDASESMFRAETFSLSPWRAQHTAQSNMSNTCKSWILQNSIDVTKENFMNFRKGSPLSFIWKVSFDGTGQKCKILLWSYLATTLPDCIATALQNFPNFLAVWSKAARKSGSLSQKYSKNAHICQGREERKCGHHSFLQFTSLPKTIAVHYIQTVLLWGVVWQCESRGTFLDVPSVPTTHQAAELPSQSHYKHTHRCSHKKTPGEPRLPACHHRAFLCKRQVMGDTCWSPKLSLTKTKPVPPPSPCHGALWHLQPRSPSSCANPELTGRVWRHQPGVTTASDLLMFIGNE